LNHYLYLKTHRADARIRKPSDIGNKVLDALAFIAAIALFVAFVYGTLSLG
jgi:hypothetical protein